MDPHQAIVIVVEDEALIRLLAADVLTDAGFTVVEAEHAAGALAVLQSRAGGVHVLFTDIHMPGVMNGLQLAHHARQHWPSIAILIASGEARPTAKELPVGSRFLPKPYDFNRMIQHVRELLAAA